jgi:hypothetical protein
MVGPPFYAFACLLLEVRMNTQKTLRLALVILALVALFALVFFTQRTA